MKKYWEEISNTSSCISKTGIGGSLSAGVSGGTSVWASGCAWECTDADDCW